MKKLFPGYYRPTPSEFEARFKTCLFVFDANSLLNLYRYTAELRDSFTKVLTLVKDRVWLPHQVASEYQRNRVETIVKQLNLSGELEAAIDVAIKTAKALQRTNLFKSHSLVESISKQLEAIKRKLQGEKEEKPDLMSEDPILNFLTDLFDGRVGPPYTEKEYKEHCKQGQERYSKKIPPGYKDKEKGKSPDDPAQFGDYIIWRQLSDKATTEQRPVILITDDAKEDWWRIEHGKTLGPRPELIQEIVAGGCQWFYMYSTEQFLTYSKEWLGAEITPAVIKEAEEIKQEDKKERRQATVSMAGGAKTVLDLLDVLKFTKLNAPLTPTYLENAQRMIDQVVTQLHFSREQINAELAKIISTVTSADLTNVIRALPLPKMPDIQ